MKLTLVGASVLSRVGARGLRLVGASRRFISCYFMPLARRRFCDHKRLARRVRGNSHRRINTVVPTRGSAIAPTNESGIAPTRVKTIAPTSERKIAPTSVSPLAPTIVRPHRTEGAGCRCTTATLHVFE